MDSSSLFSRGSSNTLTKASRRHVSVIITDVLDNGCSYEINKKRDTCSELISLR